eukprot:TRINITY_DN5329_c0_g1_i1.p1 TRINITY_DN5329_c0_g1~~TRINITY_DN5329_c0_g1_i1.p1  ORF type:complete len:151 (-),score=24.51 TRINITY_DN5329_c0_g1_i1:2-406(-)
MDVVGSIRFPTDVLKRILHFLALDGATPTWTHLAYLTHRNYDLPKIARTMQRPLVLQVELVDSREFILPFRQSNIVSIEIDWGDGQVDIINQRGEGFASHEYEDLGEYTVRVFPHGPGGGENGDLARSSWMGKL